uniref:Major facilitator superfamily (MFS) profile domain-containing protein n=1 Tax=Ascaris lumbricoides TaxID=6252 RepID=A0A9J2PXK5_ASCLU
MMMQQKNDSGTVSAGFDSQHFSSRRELSCDSAMPTPPTASKREAATLKDLQKCGGYVYFLTVTYGMMVFSQTINLIFMTFADRKGTTEFKCVQSSSRACNKTDCWISFNGTDALCEKTLTFDFGSIREEATTVSLRQGYSQITSNSCSGASHSVDDSAVENQSGLSRSVAQQFKNKNIPETFQFATDPQHVKLGTALQNVGLLLGALVFGNLADIIGRKWVSDNVLIGASIGLAASELASSFANSFWVFTVARLIVNFNGGKHCTCNPYLMENLPDSSRMWVATLVTYSPMYVALAGLAYLCKDWRTLARASAIITLAPLFMLFFVEETPRWLIQKGRDKEAERAVLAIKRWDGKIPDELRESVHSVVQSESERERERRAAALPKYNSLHIFKSWMLTKYAIVFSISLFSASFVSYGIAFNMEALAGTVYINVLILGTSRYAINIFAVILERASKRVGRRLLHIGAITFIVLVIAAVMVVYISAHDSLDAYSKATKEGREGEVWVGALYQFNRIAALLGAAMCTEIFVLNAVQPPELFPTPIRSGSNAFIQMFNRLGTILSPLLFKPASDSFTADWWAPAPYFLMTATSLTDLILYAMWIPETRGKPIPDKMPPEITGKTEKASVTTNLSASQSEVPTMAAITLSDRQVKGDKSQSEDVDGENYSMTGSAANSE